MCADYNLVTHIYMEEHAFVLDGYDGAGNLHFNMEWGMSG